MNPDVVTLDLFMGAYSDETVSKCFRHGAIGYVLKGGGVDELAHAVIAAGKGNYYLSKDVGKLFFDTVKFSEKRI